MTCMLTSLRNFLKFFFIEKRHQLFHVNSLQDLIKSMSIDLVLRELVKRVQMKITVL